MNEDNEQSTITESESKPYAQKILPIVILAVVIYAVADFYLQIKYQQEISSTLTTCWFSFWGVEIISLATIKVTKTRNKKQSNGKDDEEL